MITYVCPKCGNNLEQIVLTSLPPIHVFKCHKCGFRKEKREQFKKVTVDT